MATQTRRGKHKHALVRGLWAEKLTKLLTVKGCWVPCSGSAFFTKVCRCIDVFCFLFPSQRATLFQKDGSKHTNLHTYASNGAAGMFILAFMHCLGIHFSPSILRSFTRVAMRSGVITFSCTMTRSCRECREDRNRRRFTSVPLYRHTRCFVRGVLSLMEMKKKISPRCTPVRVCMCVYMWATARRHGFPALFLRIH